MENVNYRQLYENLLEKHELTREKHHQLVLEESRRSEEMQMAFFGQMAKNNEELAKAKLALTILDKMELPVEAQAVVQTALSKN